MAPSDEPIVVEVGRDAGGQDEVISTGTPAPWRRSWVAAAVGAVVIAGAVLGWTAHQPTARPPAPVVAARASVAPPPVGCPDGSQVTPLDVAAPDDLMAALHVAFPTFVTVDGVRGFSGTTGALCGATLTARDPDGVTVDVTVASGLARGPSQVTRLEQDGPNVRSELVRVTPQGWTIDVLVHGPTGDRAPTRAMSRLANDPRLTNPT